METPGKKKRPDDKCTNCGCTVDSHFDNRHACLKLYCDCPFVDYVKASALRVDPDRLWGFQ